MEIEDGLGRNDQADDKGGGAWKIRCWWKLVEQIMDIWKQEASTFETMIMNRVQSSSRLRNPRCTV